MDLAFQSAIRNELTGIVKEEAALKQSLSRLRFQLKEVEATLNKYKGAETVLERLQAQFSGVSSS